MQVFRIKCDVMSFAIVPHQGFLEQSENFGRTFYAVGHVMVCLSGNVSELKQDKAAQMAKKVVLVN